jgi:ribosomal protein S18 acetylase RimI-like enzyme
MRPLVTIEKATLEDKNFLVKAILEADKSFTNTSSYSQLLEMSENELVSVFHELFEEELEGCEFGHESFAIARIDGENAGTCASWIEGASGLPSWQLRTTALFCSVPSKNMNRLKQNTETFSSINLPRTPGSLQIESVYIEPQFRGKGVFLELLNFHINFTLKQGFDFNIVELLTYNSNVIAEAAYRKVGFEKVQSSHSEHPQIKNFYPSDGMTLWQKKV